MEGRNDQIQMIRCRIRLKRISVRRNPSPPKIRNPDRFGHLPRPLHIGAEEIDFLHMIFFSRAVVPIGQKAKTANMFSFGQAVRSKERPFGKYLYGVNPLTRSLISLISSRIWLMTLPGPFRSRASVILIDSPLSLSTSSIFPKWSFPSMIWKASV